MKKELESEKEGLCGGNTSKYHRQREEPLSEQCWVLVEVGVGGSGMGGSITCIGGGWGWGQILQLPLWMWSVVFDFPGLISPVQSYKTEGCRNCREAPSTALLSPTSSKNCSGLHLSKVIFFILCFWDSFDSTKALPEGKDIFLVV